MNISNNYQTFGQQSEFDCIAFSIKVMNIELLKCFMTNNVVSSCFLALSCILEFDCITITISLVISQCKYCVYIICYHFSSKASLQVKYDTFTHISKFFLFSHSITTFAWFTTHFNYIQSYILLCQPTKVKRLISNSSQTTNFQIYYADFYSQLAFLNIVWHA